MNNQHKLQLETLRKLPLKDLRRFTSERWGIYNAERKSKETILREVTFYMKQTEQDQATDILSQILCAILETQKGEDYRKLLAGDLRLLAEWVEAGKEMPVVVLALRKAKEESTINQDKKRIAEDNFMDPSKTFIKP